jgi:hypothetical protein
MFCHHNYLVQLGLTRSLRYWADYKNFLFSVLHAEDA